MEWMGSYLLDELLKITMRLPRTIGFNYQQLDDRMTEKSNDSQVLDHTSPSSTILATLLRRLQGTLRVLKSLWSWIWLSSYCNKEVWEELWEWRTRYIVIRDPFPYSFFRTKSSSVITLTSSSCLIKEQIWQKQLFVSEGLRLESMKRMNQTLQPFIAVSGLPEDHPIFHFPPSITGMTSHIYDDQTNHIFSESLSL